jgi:cell division protein FtsZ
MTTAASDADAGADEPSSYQPGSYQPSSYESSSYESSSYRASSEPSPTPAREIPRQEAARPERVSASEPAAKTFDVPVTRRRPVVFEEDDDLDVPDFLK